MLDYLCTRGQHWLSHVHQLKGSPEVPNVTFSTDSLSTNGDSGVIPILFPRSCWNAVQWCHKHLLLPVVAKLLIPRWMWCCRWCSEGALSTQMTVYMLTFWRKVTTDTMVCHCIRHKQWLVYLSCGFQCHLAQPNPQKSCDWKYTELSANITCILFQWCMAGPWSPFW